MLWRCLSSYSGGCDVRAVDAVLAAVRKQCIPQLLCLLRMFLSQEEMEVVGVLTTSVLTFYTVCKVALTLALKLHSKLKE